MPAGRPKTIFEIIFDKDKVLELYYANVPYDKMAKTLGCSIYILRKFIKYELSLPTHRIKPKRVSIPSKRDLEIVALYPGLKMHEIADKFNLTTQRVQQILAKNGIKGCLENLHPKGKKSHNYKHIDLDKVRKLRAKNQSLQKIAKQIGISQGTLSVKLIKAGEGARENPITIVTLNRKLTVKQVQNIWKEIQNPNRKRTIDEIAKEYNVCPALISHIKSGYVWNSVTGLPRLDKKELRGHVNRYFFDRKFRTVNGKRIHVLSVT